MTGWSNTCPSSLYSSLFISSNLRFKMILLHIPSCSLFWHNYIFIIFFWFFYFFFTYYFWYLGGNLFIIKLNLSFGTCISFINNNNNYKLVLIVVVGGKEQRRDVPQHRDVVIRYPSFGRPFLPEDLGITWEKSPTVANTPTSGGSLGLRIDEERSKLR